MKQKTSSIIKKIKKIPKYIGLGIQCLFSVEKQKELKIEKKIIPTIIITLLITTYLLSIFIISRWYVQNKRNKVFSEELKENTEQIEEKEKFIEEYKETINSTTTSQNQNNNYPSDLNFLNINLSKYINQNSETVAWIQVNGTNINYPVVQSTNNEYYLNHDFYKRKTNIGWVFGDYRDDFQDFKNNTIIYAHNLVNRSMFGQLPFLLKKNWQSNTNNYYIKLSTKNTNTIWKIFSVYKIAPTIDYMQVIFNSPEEYNKLLNTIKTRSEYNFKENVNSKDKIITLSTCDDIGTKRVVVHAKLYKIEEKK